MAQIVSASDENVSGRNVATTMSLLCEMLNIIIS